ncbi:hypothetical protein [Bacteroides reticulotermitis]|uniref:Uncharacterized protein n=1 Tax=Bacteroides reticulotermitis TaxID=1133319 RepID=A0A840D6E3_9BACE|nr:hypothetical protein [Bacteroides reticulotermitis]MBB4046379.1 hypothetical protein [Bacteroides reticulotermitis]
MNKEKNNQKPPFSFFEKDIRISSFSKTTTIHLFGILIYRCVIHSFDKPINKTVNKNENGQHKPRVRVLPDDWFDNLSDDIHFDMDDH